MAGARIEEKGCPLALHNLHLMFIIYDIIKVTPRRNNTYSEPTICEAYLPQVDGARKSFAGNWINIKPLANQPIQNLLLLRSELS